ncbi:MAG: ABC transporter permease [Ruminococcus sp.]|nr:ABC transporter permease [Ruminococcus sp.]
MFFTILKKDLKRKKTMNVILLIFIILASTFVASSVNNIMSVTKAVDNYFESSGVPDYLLAVRGRDSSETISKTLSEVEGVTGYGCEEIILAEDDSFLFNGKEINFKNSSIIMSFEDAQIKFFDMDNKEITGVEQGTVVLSGKTIANSDIEVGSTLTLKIGAKTLDVKVADSCKDAVFGSELMGMTRFLLNEKDFDYLYSENDKDVLYGTLWYIDSDNIDALNKIVYETDNVFFNGDKEILKMAYVLDMVIAGILLIISVCLILVAFVVLKFTISFTLSEEFREIGVMKAIGIKNSKIRRIYLVKYLGMSIAGAAVGFFASIPFSKLLLKSTSKTIVIKSENSILINLICCFAVILIILLFCYLCTGKVKKFTPIDAIRNGQTGERFKQKSVIRLSKTKGRPSFFMALNDILSAPKRYLSIIFTYILCMTIVLVLVNSTHTLRSDQLITTFGTYESDVYFSGENSDLVKAITRGEREGFEELVNNVESELKDAGIPSRCSLELFFKYNITHGEKHFKSMTLYGFNSTADMYSYHEGTPPQNKNEVAITPLVSEKLNAEIGDTITISHSFGERDYIVTAYYQSMNNLGEGVRLHEDAEVDFSQVAGTLTFQINYTDSPDEKTIAERMDILKDIYGEENVQTAGELVETMTGVASTIDSVKSLSLALTIIIIVLITLLTERSFIKKETSEIATLKAIGFRTSSIVSWHSFRFIIIAIISSIVSAIISTPVTKLTIDPIFKMMGAAYGIEYEIKPLEVFVIYPVLLLAATVISSVLTSLHTKKINPSQATGIE